jgi:hypothetical protein
MDVPSVGVDPSPLTQSALNHCVKPEMLLMEVRFGQGSTACACWVKVKLPIKSNETINKDLKDFLIFDEVSGGLMTGLIN